MAFDFEFTKDHLEPIIPNNKDVDDWYEALCNMLPKYGITSERRVAHFLSQCAHESANFKRLEENLNYSAKALRAVFGRYFGSSPKRNADEYHRNPEMIANYVYMDEFRKYKMGNVNEILPILLFLCSKHSSMMGGCLVPIDAGEGKAYQI